MTTERKENNEEYVNTNIPLFSTKESGIEWIREFTGTTNKPRKESEMIRLLNEAFKRNAV